MMTPPSALLRNMCLNVHMSLTVKISQECTNMYQHIDCRVVLREQVGNFAPCCISGVKVASNAVVISANVKSLQATKLRYTTDVDCESILKAIPVSVNIM